MQARRDEAELMFRRVGITFAVYGTKDEDGAGTERLIPFDLIPRIIPKRRVAAARSRAAPARQRRSTASCTTSTTSRRSSRPAWCRHEQVLNNAQFRPEMVGVDVPGGVYSHIAGIDIVRAANPDGSGTYYVLEDNLRVPSGVSYMLENRKMMMRLFPELFTLHRVAPVAHYPDLLLETLRAVAPAGVNEPTVVVLTPGMYNSAYFEHAFLAQQMGVELVEGKDLFVKDGFVYMRTTQGPQRVDVIYRRVDDDFLDPAGVPARLDARLRRPARRLPQRQHHAGQRHRHRRGRRQVDLPVRAEDDRVLPRRKADPAERAHLPVPRRRGSEVRARPSARAGGQGGARRRRLRHAGRAGGDARPRSRRSARSWWPTRRTTSRSRRWRCRPARPIVEAGIAPRHIDLRPFVLSGKTVQMVPGGLTRVALKEGSLVVNSSQGGGTKDTWVLEVLT